MTKTFIRKILLRSVERLRSGRFSWVCNWKQKRNLAAVAPLSDCLKLQQLQNARIVQIRGQFKISWTRSNQKIIELLWIWAGVYIPCWLVRLLVNGCKRTIIWVSSVTPFSLEELCSVRCESSPTVVRSEPRLGRFFFGNGAPNLTWTRCSIYARTRSFLRSSGHTVRDKRASSILSVEAIRARRWMWQMSWYLERCYYYSVHEVEIWSSTITRTFQ